MTLLLIFTPLFAANNVHKEANKCRRHFATEGMNLACWRVCTKCHPPTKPIEALDIYTTGDAELCAECHADKTAKVEQIALLSVGGVDGGNHPSQIYYDPVSSSTELTIEPLGPLLFVDQDGNHPKLLCSSCHDSKSDSPNLLRISNQGSNLCLSCHIK